MIIDKIQLLFDLNIIVKTTTSTTIVTKQRQAITTNRTM